MKKTKSKYKLIIFDFDGTLGDTFDWFVKNIRTMAKKYNFRSVEDHEIAELRNHDVKYMMDRVGFPKLKLPLMAVQMRNLMTAEIDSIDLFEGVPTLLQNLFEAGYLIAVVSTNSLQNIKQVLGETLCRLIDHFECGVGMFGKESKLKKTVRKCMVEMNEAIYIADELRDIDAALKIGMAFGAVSWGYTCVEALKKKKPEFVFENISDIYEKLAN